MRIDDILNRLEAAENDFLQREREVLAPVLPGRGVIVRIAGIVCTLRVTGKRFTGWGVLRPESLKTAKLVRPATLAEISRLPQALPGAAADRRRARGATVVCAARNRGQKGIQLNGPAPVLLAEAGIQPFETVLARFDATLCGTSGATIPARSGAGDLST